MCCWLCAHLVLARERHHRVECDRPHRAINEEPEQVDADRHEHEEPKRADRASTPNVSTVEAKEADGERRVGPQDGEEDRQEKYARRDPGHVVAVLSDLRFQLRELRLLVGRGR